MSKYRRVRFFETQSPLLQVCQVATVAMETAQQQGIPTRDSAIADKMRENTCVLYACYTWTTTKMFPRPHDRLSHRNCETACNSL